MVLFDHVGAGHSDISAYRPDKYGSLRGYADDVLEIVDGLGLADVIFVGHSVSSMIGVLAAVEGRPRPRIAGRAAADRTGRTGSPAGRRQPAQPNPGRRPAAGKGPGRPGSPAGRRQPARPKPGAAGRGARDHRGIGDEVVAFQHGLPRDDIALVVLRVPPEGG